MSGRDALKIILLIGLILLVFVLIVHFAARTPSLRQPEGALSCPIFLPWG